MQCDPGCSILMRTDHEPAGRRTYQIKWVTGYQRQSGFGGGSQNAEIIGIDDLDPIHFIAKQRGCGLKLDFVHWTDIF
jgi:hypothetical protein